PRSTNPRPSRAGSQVTSRALRKILSHGGSIIFRVLGVEAIYGELRWRGKGREHCGSVDSPTCGRERCWCRGSPFSAAVLPFGLAAPGMIQPPMSVSLTRRPERVSERLTAQDEGEFGE